MPLPLPLIAFKEEKNGRLTSIEATIHVERDSQKGVIIGKKGSKLKQIGEAARKEIEQMLATKRIFKALCAGSEKLDPGYQGPTTFRLLKAVFT